MNRFIRDSIITPRAQLQSRESVTQTSKAGVALDKISHSMICITQLNSHIASATSQQTPAAEKIDKGLVKINHLIVNRAEKHTIYQPIDI